MSSADSYTGRLAIASALDARAIALPRGSRARRKMMAAATSEWRGLWERYGVSRDPSELWRPTADRPYY
jgi:hypothetical protein